MHARPSALFALAQEIAAIYAAHPLVKAILLTGSVGRGDADAYSDIDLIIYYDTLPSSAALQHLCERAHGSHRVVYPGGSPAGMGEEYEVDGVNCECAHMTIALWEDIVTAVLTHYDTHLWKQKALAGMRTGTPLYGSERITQWQTQIASYPDGLRSAMMRKHLAFPPRWVLERAALARGDVLWRYELFVQTARMILGVLVGLNRVYHPGAFKRLDALLASMTMTLPDLATRLNAVFQADPREGVRQLGALVAETLALIEQVCPDIDLTQARHQFMQPGPA